MSQQIALFIDFENIAIWAEQEFFDFELSQLMEYLQSRGPVVIKRAYADWTRFRTYRDDMLNHSIDLIQLYSVRSSKNRGDIRLVLDAFETCMTRPQISTFTIVTGDSDFGPLAAKLREYGRYVIGIGPRAITHQLLVRSCDEFVYLETLIGEEPEEVDIYPQEREETRNLLRKSLAVYGQRGELPVLASRLKQTMLLIDPTFNEAKLGYNQFRDLLEANGDLCKIYFKDLQIYVAPADFKTPEHFGEVTEPPAANGSKNPVPTSSPAETEADKKVNNGGTARKTAEKVDPDRLLQQYRQVYQKTLPLDMPTRRDILRDIYRELIQHPGELTVDGLIGELQKRYETQGLERSRTMLLKVWQMGFKQWAYRYKGTVSFNTPVTLNEDIPSEGSFITRVESGFAFAVVRAGYKVSLPEMAEVFYGSRAAVDEVQELLDNLEERNQIVRVGKEYRLPAKGAIPFLDDPNLKVILEDIENAQVPDTLNRDPETANRFSERGKTERSHSFSTAAQNYLIACYLQRKAVEKRLPDANLNDLRFYLISYASVKAGELSQTQHNYAGARPYYLAFFSLAQEDDPIWNRVRGLINPMLYYYWMNLARELGITPPKQITTPAEAAVFMAMNHNPVCRERWLAVTGDLAKINPDLLRRFANQLRLNQEEMPESAQTADQIMSLLED